MLVDWAAGVEQKGFRNNTRLLLGIGWQRCLVPRVSLIVSYPYMERDLPHSRAVIGMSAR
jgi:hypothetical protein